MTNRLSSFATSMISNNPITQQILGICSALAVTTTVATAITMAAALTLVLCSSNAVISAIRDHIPNAIRLIVQITIIATMVIITDQFLQAFAFELSRQLSIFVGLIVTNCLVLGRAEVFAMHHPVGPSVVDGLQNSLGYGLILLVVGTIREFLGQGTWLGWAVLPTVAEGGWFEPLGLMSLAPSAYIIIGLLVWAIRSNWKQLAEPVQFKFKSSEKQS